jgi:pimeloyl-ACP methyl ester carboxylesterase
VIVLVHGLGVSHRYFARLRRALPGALAPDLDGEAVPELADSLARAAPPGRATLVANSLGCQIAVELALREPARVERLVLIGPTWDPASPSLAGQAARVVRDSLGEPPSLWPVLAYEYARWGPRRILAAARAMLADPVAEKLPRVEAPAVVVRGERDGICSQAWAERFAALLPRGRLVVVPGAHAVHWSHARFLARVVEEADDDLGER